MKIHFNFNRVRRFCQSAFLGALTMLSLSPDTQAGLFKLDFGALGPTGGGNPEPAEGWDTIGSITAEDECSFDGSQIPCSIFNLTDYSGEKDNDVKMEIMEVPFLPNNPVHLTEPQVYDGIEVPLEVLGDYQYRNPDTAGSSAPFRFSNLNPGNYRVTVFEGRTSDGNGQFAKVWVGDANGSNEPGEVGSHEGKNTKNFAAGSDTLNVNVGQGQFLWYRHLEDNSGGISGIIIRPVPGVPGDFNNDKKVDFADFLVMANNFNGPGGTPQGDMDFNGRVNLADFIKFRSIVDAAGAAASGSAAAVPEPSCGLLALIALGNIAYRRSRRSA